MTGAGAGTFIEPAAARYGASVAAEGVLNVLLTKRTFNHIEGFVSLLGFSRLLSEKLNRSCHCGQQTRNPPND